MADVATVRAEIKAWERSFKEDNGREATIQDIKDNPAIATKYKLYKKLTKAAAAPEPPSTPPSRSRSFRDHAALQLGKPRLIETTSPLSTFNPFSPQKSKGKQRATTTATQALRSNPFATPSKANSKSKYTSASPDPFPVIVPQSAPSSPSPAPRTLNGPTTAVSRARKRLRGEPVSPSPTKQKRPRIASQTTLSFHNDINHASSSEDEYGENAVGNSSFVDDSPVKASHKDKSFKLLFEDNPTSMPAKATIPPPRFLSAHAETSRQRSRSVSVNPDDDVGLSLHAKSNGRTTKSAMHNIFAPSKDNLHSAPEPPFEKAKPTKSKDRPARVSVKRAFSDDEMDIAEAPTESVSSYPTLLPPSPPPAGSSSHRTSGQYNAKRKTSATTGRKKAKMAEQEEIAEDDDDDDSVSGNVKLVQPSHTRARLPRTEEDGGDLDPESDPIFAGAPHVRGQTNGQSVSEEGVLEVDLPDKLRQVLELSSSESRVRGIREERVVAGLLYGRREGHYDAMKGGEIWDVGEDVVGQDEEGKDNRETDGEDDWEGEPVPWEVGEL